MAIRGGVERTAQCGKYRLLRLIGKGGLGSVYEAEHVEIRRRVAVKLPHPQYAKDAEVVERLRREALIAGGLGHHNICAALDVGVSDDGEPYVAMELLRGAPLSEVVAAGPLPPARALGIVCQVLDALSAAHGAGVVHRDLKPDNVFITEIGELHDFVKVLDFGISKVALDSAFGGGALTQTGSVLGTPYYMAPEQARGAKDQDHRVDIYAAGVMLYELVTGRRPYEGDSVQELIVKIVSEDFPRPRVHRPDLPAAVEAVILRAMARDRAARFPSAREMREECLYVASRLEAAPEGVSSAVTTTPLTATPSVEPVTTSGRSRPLAIAAAVVLTAALVGGLAWWNAKGPASGASGLPRGPAAARLEPAPASRPDIDFWQGSPGVRTSPRSGIGAPPPQHPVAPAAPLGPEGSAVRLSPAVPPEPSAGSGQADAGPPRRHPRAPPRRGGRPAASPPSESSPPPVEEFVR